MNDGSAAVALEAPAPATHAIDTGDAPTPTESSPAARVGLAGGQRKKANADPRVANRAQDPRRQQEDPRRRSKLKQKQPQPAPKPQASAVAQGMADGIAPRRLRVVAPNGVSKRAHDAEIKLDFTPRSSASYRLGRVQLKSAYAQSLFKNRAGDASVAIYSLIQLLPIRIKQDGRTPDAKKISVAIETHVDQMIAGADALLEVAMVDVLKMRSDFMPPELITDDDKIHFTGAVTQTIRCYTPQMSAFLRLLKKFDDWTEHLDLLWHNGHLNGGNAERGEHISHVRKAIVRLSRSLFHLHRQFDELLRYHPDKKQLDFDAILVAAYDVDELPEHQLTAQEMAAAETMVSNPED